MKKPVLFTLFLAVTTAFGQSTDPNDFRPLPLPEWSEPAKSAPNDHYLVGYDVNNKTEFLADTNKYLETGTHLSSPPYIPDGVQVSEGMSQLKNFSDLEPIPDPTFYPARTTVKIFIKFPNTEYTYVGSGIMISKSVVLTAGHCIYSHELGGWATNISVVPAYDNGSDPFGRQSSMTLYSWTAWTESGNLEWDMGMISLNCSVGLITGWVGFGTNDDNNFFTSNYFHNFSYPAEYPYYGTTMYYRSGTFDDVSQYILYFNRLSYGGQSGSGFTSIDANNNFYNYAVLSHGYSNPPQTGCTRITSDKIHDIRKVADENQNTSTCPVGIDENQINEQVALQVYPNPASDKINIHIGSSRKAHVVSVFSLLGVKVYEGAFEPGIQEITVPLGNMTAGLYLVHVSDGNTGVTRSFLKSSDQ